MIQPPRRHQGRGFSLLELIVAIGIFALFTLTLSRLMMGGMQTFKKGEAITSLRQDLRQALDLISSDFRQSNLEVTTPSFPSGKNKTLTLTFKRYVNDTGGPTLHAITYTINGTTNRLTRTDLNDASNPTVLVANNILVGTRLGETVSADLSQSYFVWSINPNVAADADRNFGTLEVRLTGMNQEQRLSMVTQISQRLDIDASGTVVTPMINLLALPSDVRSVPPVRSVRPDPFAVP